MTSRRRGSSESSNDSDTEANSQDKDQLTKEEVCHKKGHPFYRSRRFLVVVTSITVVAVILVVIAIVAAVSVSLRPTGADSTGASELPSDPVQRAQALLQMYPVIDGHNDLAFAIRVTFRNQLGEFDLRESTVDYGWHTDIPRLREGMVGAQFWSAYMSCSSQYYDATRTFLDQMDVIKRFVNQYNDTFQLALTADDIERAYYDNNKIASLIGVEGGHAIDSSLGTLRSLYQLGARYMTLTHTCNTPWADSANGPDTVGLSDFGKKVVREMNRLGMMVDLSHVSALVMSQALDHSVAPVIFSHSSAYSLCHHPRNVPDDILRKMPDNGGIVMVNFFPLFINCSIEYASLEQVADHIDYIKELIGVDYVGIGGDYDGIPSGPKGLEDVSKYPALFAELIRRGYSDEDVAKIAHKNLIRVFKHVEEVRDDLVGSVTPDDSLIDPQPNQTCRPDF